MFEEVFLKFNAYIDGFNLYKGSLEKRGNLKWVDLVRFCKMQMPDCEIGQIYYFTAPLKKKFPEDKANERQHAYLRVLEDQGINVIKGKFQKSESWLRIRASNRKSFTQPSFKSLAGINQIQINRVFREAEPDFPKAPVNRFEEKGSDVNLASYLLKDVFVNELKSALVVTGDSDLTTPIKFASEFGAHINLLVPGDGLKTSSLSSVASITNKVDLAELGISQLPNPYILKSGSKIYKPKMWV